MKKALWVGLAILAVMMVLPFTAAAMTNSEIIAVLAEAFSAVRDLTRDAYCAAGVAAFCP